MAATSPTAARAAAGRRVGRGAALAAALVAATLLAFSPVVRNEFINYDDDTNLVKNLQVQRGFTAESLRWAFTNLESGNWHPLTWLSHMLDFQVFGLRAGGHHAVSALIHAASAALLFAVLRAMTGAFWRSALVAALFALHPLRVESVAWAAERKDVLTVLFGLAALGSHLRFARNRSAGAYAASLALFACALMSKAMLVTLPALLLLLDFWPLGRWPAGRGPLFPAVRWLLLEKLPFFALSAAASVLAFNAQAGGGSVAYVVQFPVGQRIANAALSAAKYLGTSVWPTGLAVFYPYFWGDTPWWQPALGASLIVLVSAAAIAGLRRRPALFVGWAWYLGTLLPVIGLIQVGSQSMADRYTYLPQIGVLLMAAWGLGDLAAGRPRARAVFAAATPVVLAALGATTFVYAATWRSSETLFSHALAVTRDNYIAYSNLGSALADKGRVAEGNELIRRGFQVNPTYRASVLDRAGDFYARRGQAREAAENYRRVLEIEPFNRTTREKLRALGETGSLPPAAAAPNPHAGFQPAAANAGAFERGNALIAAGRREEAAEAFREAVRLAPANAEAWNNLGGVLGELGRRVEAEAAFTEALRLNPGHAAASSNLRLLRAAGGARSR